MLTQNEQFQRLYDKYEEEILKDEAICETDKQRYPFASKHYMTLTGAGLPLTTIRALNKRVVYENSECRLAYMIYKMADLGIKFSLNKLSLN